MSRHVLIFLWKCKDSNENASTKRKMQGRHKKLFLGLLRASWTIKNLRNVLNHDPFFHSGPFSVLERPFPVLECPFPVFLSFCFWESDFVPGRPRTEDFVPRFLLLLLSRHKGTAGQGFFLSQDKGTSGQGTFFVLDKGTTGCSIPDCPGTLPLETLVSSESHMKAEMSLNLRKILVTPKIFLKLRFFCLTYP